MMDRNLFNWEEEEAVGTLLEDFSTSTVTECTTKLEGCEAISSSTQGSMEAIHPSRDIDTHSMTPSTHSKESTSHSIQEGFSLLNIRTKASFDNIQRAFDPFAKSVQKLISKQLNQEKSQPRSYDKKPFSTSISTAFVPLIKNTPIEPPKVSCISNASPILDSFTIMNNIINDKPFTFNNFRSYQDKEQLLVAALDTCHSSCIIQVVLFLRETLKHELFKTLIEKYPNAWEEYRYFLKALGQLDILKITHSKSTLDQLLADYSNLLHERLSSNSIDNMDKLVKKYKNYKLYKDYVDSIEIHADLLRYQLTLKEGQKSLAESHDIIMECANENIIKPGENMINTARILIYRHLESIPFIPYDLKRQFKLNELQFEYLIVKVCCSLQKWDILNQFFIDKSSSTISVFKSKTPTSAAGFGNICKLLKNNQAPDEIILHYLPFIVDINQRIDVAESIKCYEYALSCLISIRNRKLLEEFSRRIPSSYDKVHKQIIEFLTSSNIKWK